METGVAAGVPFVASPPASGRADAPVVVAWHLLDSPRTERAFAAALPLAGLDAWRVYLGLPLTGARLPAGGPDEVMRLAYEDAVLKLHGPVATGAAAEFPAAYAALRDRFGFGAGPLGLVGGSIGSAVTQLVIAEAGLPVSAAVLVSPVTQLTALVAAMSARYGVTYGWSAESRAMAGRLDFVARAGEITVPTLLVVGEKDDQEGVLDPAAALHAALPGSALETVPGMAHAFADEPGVDAAPQTADAAAVDRLAVDWLRRHLG